jgi:hypothetical protein
VNLELEVVTLLEVELFSLHGEVEATGEEPGPLSFGFELVGQLVALPFEVSGVGLEVLPVHRVPLLRSPWLDEWLQADTGVWGAGLQGGGVSGRSPARNSPLVSAEHSLSTQSGHETRGKRGEREEAGAGQGRRHGG